MSEIVKQIPLYIGGEWLDPEADPAILTSPSTGDAIAEVHQGSAKDVTRAVQSAIDAFSRLSAMTAFERAGLAHRIADALLAHKDEIARDLSREIGGDVSGCRRVRQAIDV
jgi:aldehyde dehydrogenase (NAD+)